MDEKYRVLVHGENYVLRFVHSDLENLPYSERLSVDDIHDEAVELSYAEVVGFYTTLTLTVASSNQLRDEVSRRLLSRLKKSHVAPIERTGARSYVRIDSYEKLTHLKGHEPDEDGFTFYPMSLWWQIKSIIVYYFSYVLCQMGLRDPVRRPIAVRTLPTC